MRPTLVPGAPQQDGHVIRAVGSAVIALLAYLGALWLQWWGEVPEALWVQMGYVLPGAELGSLLGGSLADLFGPGQSWSLALYGAFPANLVSVVAAMAATFAFRVTALPRLTFALAFILLSIGLAVFARASSLVCRRGIARSEDGARFWPQGISSSGPDSVLRMLESRDQLTVVCPGADELIMASARVHADFNGLTLNIEPRALRWPIPLLKRTVDVVLSLVVLVAGLPIWLLVMLAIRLSGTSVVPPGKGVAGGRLFEVIKFRTMVADAEAASGPVLASADGPRVTRVGRYLRAFRLDEIPQFINVLRGEMSVVGPRPERRSSLRSFARRFRVTTYATWSTRASRDWLKSAGITIPRPRTSFGSTWRTSSCGLRCPT